jgi:hypothetical protein
MGLRELRKKFQRDVIRLAQCQKAEVALRELGNLKVTVDGQIERLRKQFPAPNKEVDQC